MLSFQKSFSFRTLDKALHREQTQFEEAPFFIIHPHSTFRIMWDIVTVIFLLINAFTIPFNIAFHDEVSPPWAYTLFLISDIWFMVDILINLRTGKRVHNRVPKKLG